MRPNVGFDGEAHPDPITSTDEDEPDGDRIYAFRPAEGRRTWRRRDLAEVPEPPEPELTGGRRRFTGDSQAARRDIAEAVHQHDAQLRHRMGVDVDTRDLQGDFVSGWDRMSVDVDRDQGWVLGDRHTHRARVAFEEPLPMPPRPRDPEPGWPDASPDEQAEAQRRQTERDNPMPDQPVMEELPPRPPIYRMSEPGASHVRREHGMGAGESLYPVLNADRVERQVAREQAQERNREAQEEYEAESEQVREDRAREDAETERRRQDASPGPMTQEEMLEAHRLAVDRDQAAARAERRRPRRHTEEVKNPEAVAKEVGDIIGFIRDDTHSDRSDDKNTDASPGIHDLSRPDVLGIITELAERGVISKEAPAVVNRNRDRKERRKGQWWRTGLGDLGVEAGTQAVPGALLVAGLAEPWLIGAAAIPKAIELPQRGLKNLLGFTHIHSNKGPKRMMLAYRVNPDQAPPGTHVKGHEVEEIPYDDTVVMVVWDRKPAKGWWPRRLTSQTFAEQWEPTSINVVKTKKGEAALEYEGGELHHTAALRTAVGDSFLDVQKPANDRDRIDLRRRVDDPMGGLETARPVGGVLSQRPEDARPPVDQEPWQEQVHHGPAPLAPSAPPAEPLRRVNAGIGEDVPARPAVPERPGHAGRPERAARPNQERQILNDVNARLRAMHQELTTGHPTAQRIEDMRTEFVD
ncbi:MAG TPA: hypothetical protein VHQ86_02845, partial [Candidatus Saccharimonadia bacterium]|nr:hypothetical protein [Candidatus Saccharimonadia bacterium]